MSAGPGLARAKTTTRLRCAVSLAVDDLVARIEELETENAALKKENGELWDSVHTLQDMVERAHT